MNEIVKAISERRRAVDTALRTGTLTAGDGAALTEQYAFIYKDGPRPTLGMGRGGAADPSAAQADYIPFTISVYAEDRDGDVLLPMGGQIENYARNSVVFFGHQQWEIPIGTSRSPDGRCCVFKEPNRVRAYWYPDRADEDAAFIEGKVRRGVLSAASIAFVPIEAYRRDVEEKAATHQMRNGIPTGWLFKQWDMTEWSIVGVPANAGAIRDSLDREKSFISPRLQKALVPYAAKARGRCFSGWCPKPAQGRGARGQGPGAREEGQHTSPKRERGISLQRYSAHSDDTNPTRQRGIKGAGNREQRTGDREEPDNTNPTRQRGISTKQETGGKPVTMRLRAKPWVPPDTKPGGKCQGSSPSARGQERGTRSKAREEMERGENAMKKKPAATRTSRPKPRCPIVEDADTLRLDRDHKAAVDTPPPPAAAKQDGADEERDNEQPDQTFTPKHSAQVIAGLYSHAREEHDWLRKELDGMDNPEVVEALQSMYEEGRRPTMEELKAAFEHHHPDHGDIDEFTKCMETDGSGATEQTGEAALVDRGDIPEDEPSDEGDEELPSGSPTEPADEAEIVERYRDRTGKGFRVRHHGFVRRAADGKFYITNKDLTDQGNPAELTRHPHRHRRPIIKEEHLGAIKEAAQYMDEAADEQPSSAHRTAHRHHARTLHGVHKDLTEQGHLEETGGTGEPLSNRGGSAELKSRTADPRIVQEWQKTKNRLASILQLPGVKAS